MIGDVEGRMCVLVDDMIDTAGTICAAAAELLVERGATESGPWPPTACCRTPPSTGSRTR